KDMDVVFADVAHLGMEAGNLVVRRQVTGRASVSTRTLAAEPSKLGESLRERSRVQNDRHDAGGRRHRGEASNTDVDTDD
ncbi:MAG TPA: hypothetical protein VIJ34_00030, partial [Acidimicrobiales bacterium]